jgi:uncharacterized protein YbjT (DUF2867 family)
MSATEITTIFMVGSGGLIGRHVVQHLAADAQRLHARVTSYSKRNSRK